MFLFDESSMLDIVQRWFDIVFIFVGILLAEEE